MKSSIVGLLSVPSVNVKMYLLWSSFSSSVSVCSFEHRPPLITCFLISNVIEAALSKLHKRACVLNLTTKSSKVSLSFCFSSPNLNVSNSMLICGVKCSDSILWLRRSRHLPVLLHNRFHVLVLLPNEGGLLSSAVWNQCYMHPYIILHRVTTWTILHLDSPSYSNGGGDVKLIT